MENDGENEYLDIAFQPIMAKIDLKKNTILTSEMVQTAELRNDLRREEYNMITLPVQMEVGDYIDVRLLLPTGFNYIVLSKKEVIDANETTVWLNLTEDEILLMSSAILEAYKINGSKIYATIYTEAGNQTASTITYQPSDNIGVLINSSPNVLKEAKEELAKRYNSELRKPIQYSYDNGTEENIEIKVQEEITKQKEERANYLNGL